MRLNASRRIATRVLASLPMISETQHLSAWRNGASFETWKVRRSTRVKTVLFYTALAMIPVVIFILLLITARGH